MQERDFVCYEYKTVTAKAQEQTRAADFCEAFGWELTDVSPSFGGVVLSLRRDRKLRHRQELGRLERQAEGAAAELKALQRKKTRSAKVYARLFGAAAALVFGGGMSLCMLAQSGAALAGGVLLGLAGAALCCVNYPIFRKLAAGKAEALLPAIDRAEEKLALLLEKGDGLLRGEQF